ncbi:uncharacterized protein LOC143245162 isoform X2 [Tachypleus tridentatus]|uniref:uncharacterized protein LOC143245162 isoform X2 n=1 Tax=Tachypleus tridentatus TaxID=6853 RepID=UPI003FD6B86F
MPDDSQPVLTKLTQSKKVNFANQVSKTQGFAVCSPLTRADQLLVEAAREGDMQLLSSLMTQKRELNVDACDRRSGNTALMVACAQGHLEVVQCLLEHGADPTLHNYSGISSLKLATTNTIKSLLLDSCWSVSVEDSLQRSAWKGDDKQVEKLLTKLNSKMTNTNNQESQQNMLLLAAQDIQVFEELYQQGLIEEYSPTQVVWKLLQAGWDVNYQDKQGRTALHYCAMQSSSTATELIKILIQQHANPDIADKQSFTPLHFVARSGSAEALLELLNAGASVNAKGLANQIPLHLAASSGNITCISMLLSEGADITAITNEGKSPLHCAANNQVFELLKEALESVMIEKAEKMRLIPLQGLSCQTGMKYSCSEPHTNKLGNRLSSSFKEIKSKREIHSKSNPGSPTRAVKGIHLHQSSQQNGNTLCERIINLQISGKRCISYYSAPKKSYDEGGLKKAQVLQEASTLKQPNPVEVLPGIKSSSKCPLPSVIPPNSSTPRQIKSVGGLISRTKENYPKVADNAEKNVIGRNRSQSWDSNSLILDPVNPVQDIRPVPRRESRRFSAADVLTKMRESNKKIKSDIKVKDNLIYDWLEPLEEKREKLGLLSSHEVLTTEEPIIITTEEEPEQNFSSNIVESSLLSSSSSLKHQHLCQKKYKNGKMQKEKIFNCVSKNMPFCNKEEKNTKFQVSVQKEGSSFMSCNITSQYEFNESLIVYGENVDGLQDNSHDINNRISVVSQGSSKGPGTTKCKSNKKQEIRKAKTASPYSVSVKLVKQERKSRSAKCTNERQNNVLTLLRGHSLSLIPCVIKKIHKQPNVLKSNIPHFSNRALMNKISKKEPRTSTNKVLNAQNQCIKKQRDSLSLLESQKTNSDEQNPIVTTKIIASTNYSTFFSTSKFAKKKTNDNDEDRDSASEMTSSWVFFETQNPHHSKGEQQHSSEQSQGDLNQVPFTVDEFNSNTKGQPVSKQKGMFCDKTTNISIVYQENMDQGCSNENISEYCDNLEQKKPEHTRLEQTSSTGNSGVSDEQCGSELDFLDYSDKSSGLEGERLDTSPSLRTESEMTLEWSDEMASSSESGCLSLKETSPTTCRAVFQPFLSQSPTGANICWTKGKLLGKGAFGTVWCGLTDTGDLIAVKQVKLEQTDQQLAAAEYQAIQQEVELLRTLQHKNIVSMFLEAQ